MNAQFINDDVKKIAAVLGVSDRLVSSILVNPWHHFRREIKVTKSGKKRTFYCPDEQFKSLQGEIYKRILDKVPTPSSMHGYVRKRSPLTNARCHTNKRNVAKFDIEDFFPSIHYRRIEKLFSDLGFTQEEARILGRLTTIDYCLPHGYVTSPKLACLTLINLDKRISRILKGGNRGKHTFFSDDVTISSNNDISNLKGPVFRAINQEGFSVKERKYDLKGKGERKKVTGYTVSGPKVNLPKEYREELRALLHNCLITGPSSQMLVYEKKYGPLKLKKSTKMEKFREILWGKILYVKSANEKCFRKFRGTYSKIKWIS